MPWTSALDIPGDKVLAPGRGSSGSAGTLSPTSQHRARTTQGCSAPPAAAVHAARSCTRTDTDPPFPAPAGKPAEKRLPRQISSCVPQLTRQLTRGHRSVFKTNFQISLAPRNWKRVEYWGCSSSPSSVPASCSVSPALRHRCCEHPQCWLPLPSGTRREEGWGPRCHPVGRGAGSSARL